MTLCRDLAFGFDSPRSPASFFELDWCAIKSAARVCSFAKRRSAANRAISKLVGCSTRTVRAIETGNLVLSNGLASRISQSLGLDNNYPATTSSLIEQPRILRLKENLVDILFKRKLLMD
jgi:hypothetical protein